MPDKATAVGQRHVFELVDELEEQLRALGVRGEAIDLVLQLRKELAVSFTTLSGEATEMPCAP